MTRSTLSISKRGGIDLPSANKLRRKLDRVTEEYVRYTADDAQDNAPVETAALMHSIPASVTKEGTMEWIFGSHLPYAQRQEYEHKTKNAYFRRAVWANEQPFYAAIRRAIEREVRG